MTPDILLLFVVLALIVLVDLAATRWGVDTQPCFDPRINARRNF